MRAHSSSAHGVGRINLRRRSLSSVTRTIPAIALHAVEHADQRGRFDVHPLGQFRLRKFAIVRDARQDFPLPRSDTVRGQFPFIAKLKACTVANTQYPTLFSKS